MYPYLNERVPSRSHKVISQTGRNNIQVGQQERGNHEEQDRVQGEDQDRQLENNEARDDAEIQLSSSGAQDLMQVEYSQPHGGQAPNSEIVLSDQDCEDVCKTIGEIDVSKLRMALQSAVYISPMLLLADAKLYRWNWNQIDILKVRSIAFPFNPRNTNVIISTRKI